MKPRSIQMFMLFFVLFALSATMTAAALMNGSFETGTMYGGAPDIFTAGVPAPWTASVFSPDGYDNAGTDGWSIAGIAPYDNMFANMPAHSGERFVGFAASASPISFGEAFFQTTPPLLPGATYVVSAQLAADDSGNDSAANFGGPYSGRGQVDVFLDSNLIGTLTQNTSSHQWESRSFSFVAPATSAATFEFVATVDPLSSEPSYLGIDDIRVDLVPEPSTTALWGLGLLALAAWRRW